MSRGQTPRTPEYFPKMKDRSVGRKQAKRRRSIQEFTRSLTLLAQAMSTFGSTVKQAGKAMNELMSTAHWRFNDVSPK